MRSRQCALPHATSQRQRRPSAGGWNSFAVSCDRLPEYLMLRGCAQAAGLQWLHHSSRLCGALFEVIHVLEAPSGRLHVAHHLTTIVLVLSMRTTVS